MLDDADTLEVRKYAHAIQKALEGCDAFVAINAMISATVDFILVPRNVGPLTVLNDVTETLRKNVLLQLTTPETDGQLH